MESILKCPIFKRKNWTSERNVIRWYKQLLALAWILYFLLREEIVKEILKPAHDFLKSFSFYPLVQQVYEHILPILLVLTALLIIAKIIFSFLRRIVRYLLNKNNPKDIFLYLRYHSVKDYPEDVFPYQKKLVDFLNGKKDRGRNILWINGSWGSGKTHFIRTFFDQQYFKLREIYYISCFGIQTREQAERVLIEEIEQHSTFGSLDHIPVISSLVKWSYKILGLDLMKKHSIIIFDDLERVTYADNKNDNPEAYNDLLGFIDYLANHRNQKVIVVLNKKEMENTYSKIIEHKFKPVVITIPIQDELIEKVVDKDCKEDEFIKPFLKAMFKFLSCKKTVNLRELRSYI